MVKYFLFIVWISVAAHAQDVKFGVPKKLTPYVNSGCEEILPMTSADGSIIYFVRVNCEPNTGGKFAGSDIWSSNFNKETLQWNKPVNKGVFHNDKMHNAIVGVGNGDELYQLTASASKNATGIYSISRTNSWTHLKKIPFSFLETEKFLGVFIPADTSLVLLSMKNEDGQGEEDLYVSLRNSIGEWTTPRNLGPVINTKGFEISPFLSADQKRLYFASNGHKGLGDADIFYSDRLDESWEKWSVPVNLGDPINSKKFDAYFSVRDSLAYFSSNRNSHFSDIYVVSVQKPDDNERQRVDKMVAEAKSLLTDIRDDTPDSLSFDSQSIFISFLPNSIQFEESSFSKLDGVTATIKSKKLNKIKLIGYANDDLKNEGLCRKRIEVVKKYLEDIPMTKLTVETELIRNSQRDGLVEIRYE